MAPLPETSTSTPAAVRRCCRSWSWPASQARTRAAAAASSRAMRAARSGSSKSADVLAGSGGRVVHDHEAGAPLAALERARQEGQLGLQREAAVVGVDGVGVEHHEAGQPLVDEVVAGRQRPERRAVGDGEAGLAPGGLVGAEPGGAAAMPASRRRGCRAPARARRPPGQQPGQRLLVEPGQGRVGRAGRRRGHGVAVGGEGAGLGPGPGGVQAARVDQVAGEDGQRERGPGVGRRDGLRPPPPAGPSARRSRRGGGPARRRRVPAGAGAGAAAAP